MSKKMRWLAGISLSVILLILVVAVAFGPVALAAEAAAKSQAFDWGKVLSPLIIVVVPLVLYGIKQAWQKIPKQLLPVLAPILGALADVLLQWSGVNTFGAQWGAAMGMAGVGLREMFDQVSGNAKKPSSG
jgi:hypothetical protein